MKVLKIRLISSYCCRNVHWPGTNWQPPESCHLLELFLPASMNLDSPSTTRDNRAHSICILYRAITQGSQKVRLFAKKALKIFIARLRSHTETLREGVISCTGNTSCTEPHILTLSLPVVYLMDLFIFNVERFDWKHRVNSFTRSTV